MLDESTKRSTGARSSPSAPGATRGNRRRAENPIATTQTEVRSCATTIPATVAFTPCGAAITIATSRRPVARREQRAADVVTAAQDQRRGAHRLGRLQQRQARREQHRLEHPRRVEEGVREGREQDDDQGRDERRGGLEPEGEPHEAVEAAPVLLRRRSGSRTSRAPRRRSARAAAGRTPRCRSRG